MTAPALAQPEELQAAHRRAAAVEARVIRSRLRPPPRLTVSQWADRYRVLSPEASSRRGQFTTDSAPYQREPMDILGDRRHPRAVLMWGSQLGKTELVNNVVGYRIDQDPGPMLVVQPTLEMAETWSKDRLAPMLRDTPRLRGKVAHARARDSGNTLLHKQIPGGHITVAGANSPAGLASRPIRDLYLDEVDRFEKSAGSEGDPGAIAESRTATFPDATVRVISSPTIEGESAIYAEYEASDQRQYWVPCPHCKVEQLLVFGGSDVDCGLKFSREDGGKLQVWYVCQSGCVIEEADKMWMLAHGRWIAENPTSEIPGFRLSALYSPFFSWVRLVRRWLRDKSDPLKLQAFVNTMLCELWRPLAGDALTPHVLADRVSSYQPRVTVDGAEVADRLYVPPEAGVIVRLTDTQDDRLETALWAFGEGEEAWLVDFDMIPGSTSIPFGRAGSPWNELDEIDRRAYRHGGSVALHRAVHFIDSGGHAAGEVYAFTKARNHRQVFAIKGLSEQEGAPRVGKPTRNNRAKAILIPVGSFTLKETVMGRLAKVTEPGPGYIHLPDWLDDEQLNQFLRAKLVAKPEGGKMKRRWVESPPVEQFHLAAYALAAVHYLGAGVYRYLGAHAARLRAQAETARPRDDAPEAQPAAPAPRPRSGGNWVTGGGRWGMRR